VHDPNESRELSRTLSKITAHESRELSTVSVLVLCIATVVIERRDSGEVRKSNFIY